MDEKRNFIGDAIPPRRNIHSVSNGDYLDFYRAVQGNNGIERMDVASKIELMSNFLKIRSIGHSEARMPIYSSEPDKINAVFDKEYGKSEEIVNSLKNEFDFAWEVYASTIGRGLNVRDYPDYVIEISNRRGFKIPADRKEIIDYGVNLLRKYRLPQERNWENNIPYGKASEMREEAMARVGLYFLDVRKEERYLSYYDLEKIADESLGPKGDGNLGVEKTVISQEDFFGVKPDNAYFRDLEDNSNRKHKR